MLRLHKRLPNVLLPAALVFLAILANPAFASPWERTLRIRVAAAGPYAPMSGVSVRLLPMDTLLETDYRGRCSISSEYLPDTMQVTVGLDGFLAETAKVHVRPGEPVDIVLTMYRDSPRVFALGLLADARTGTPVTGAVVRLLRGAVQGPTNVYLRGSLAKILEVDTTDADGEFRVAVPPGTHMLDFTKPGYFYRRKEVHVAGDETRVRDETRMYDSGFGLASGRIVDDGAGGLVSRCGFEVEGNPQTEAEDPYGYYVILGLDPGEHRVTVSYMGYHSVQRIVVVGPGQTTVENFRLKPVLIDMH
jgi:hypothetical protein